MSSSGRATQPHATWRDEDVLLRSLLEFPLAQIGNGLLYFIISLVLRDLCVKVGGRGSQNVDLKGERKKLVFWGRRRERTSGELVITLLKELSMMMNK